MYILHHPDQEQHNNHHRGQDRKANLTTIWPSFPTIPTVVAARTVRAGETIVAMEPAPFWAAINQSRGRPARALASRCNWAHIAFPPAFEPVSQPPRAPSQGAIQL